MPCGRATWIRSLRGKAMQVARVCSKGSEHVEVAATGHFDTCIVVALPIREVRRCVRHKRFAHLRCQ